MAKRHKFDFEKLGKDILTAGVFSAPNIGFGLYGYFNNWFATRKCVEETWASRADGWGYPQCAEYAQHHGPAELFLLILFSIVIGIGFWMIAHELVNLGSAFLDRYLVCEDKTSEDVKENNGE